MINIILFINTKLFPITLIKYNKLLKIYFYLIGIKLKIFKYCLWRFEIGSEGTGYLYSFEK